MTAAELIEAHRELMYPCVTTLYDEPLVLASGSGSWVRDVNGGEYLDFFGGVLATSLGHCHPDVVAAVQQQAATLGHVSSLYITEPQIRAAQKLAEIAPGNLRRTFFTNSGTEAVETAVMLARLHTGRTEIFALRYAYSGRSTITAEMTGQHTWRVAAGGLGVGVRFVTSPYSYRFPFDIDWDRAADQFADELEEAILTTSNGKPAALVVESIQGIGGYIVPPPRYYERMAEVIRRYGGLLIADEVQSGMGRTGKWFAIEHWGVVPDIMTLAKGVASGYPVGATITTDAIASSWQGKTFSTFGGHPVCMAALTATVEVLQRENAPARATRTGAVLRAGLDALSAQHPWIGEVRGMGLMQAIEIVRDRTSKEPDAERTRALLEAAKTEGVLIGGGGLHGNVIRIGPQLLVSEDEISEGVARLGRACAQLR